LINVAFEVSDNPAQHNHFLALAVALEKDSRFHVSYYAAVRDLPDLPQFILNNKITYLTPSIQERVKFRAASVLKQLNLTRLTVFCQKVYGRVKSRKVESYEAFYSDNLKYFSDFDFVFTTELKGGNAALKSQNVKLVWLLHGFCANEYSINKDWRIDYLLCAQRNLFHYLDKTNYVAQNTKLIDNVYIKFDSIRNKEQLSSDFGLDSSKHTFVYNPHWDSKSKLSSWFTHGKNILDFFKEHSEFNLIFAPHINLIRYGLLGDLSDFKNCSNIIIDEGTKSLTDGSYYQYCDTYIGDISSQFFEYSAYKDVSAIFLNLSECVETEELSYWSQGSVVRELKEFEELCCHSDKLSVVDRSFIFKSLSSTGIGDFVNTIANDSVC
jgi:hypothetical protein